MAIDEGGYPRAIAWIKVKNNLFVLGQSKCIFFATEPIPSLDAYSLSEGLAVIDAAEKLKSYYIGKYKPLNDEEIRKWRDCFRKWGSIELLNEP